MQTVREQVAEIAAHSAMRRPIRLEKPKCKTCDDTSWVLTSDGRAKRCTCQEKRIAEGRIRTILNDWPEYAKVDLFRSKPRTMGQADAIAAIKANPDESFFFTGDYSTGKTHLLVCQYRELAIRGLNCLLRSSKELADELRQAEMKPEEGKELYVSPVLQAAGTNAQFHLFWDDIEKAAARTDFRAEAVFDLIDTIKRRQLAISITSNLKIEDLPAVIGDAVTARIDRMCRKLQL